MTDQPMSQCPSTWDYVLPVREGPDEVRITVDGREVVVPNGELLIKSAQDHGVYIPRFCWHDRMKPVGMCRMCLVEVEGMRGLQIACATPVSDGMVVGMASVHRALAHLQAPRAIDRSRRALAFPRRRHSFEAWCVVDRSGAWPPAATPAGWSPPCRTLPSTA